MNEQPASCYNLITVLIVEIDYGNLFYIRFA
jgi:hypothetical protein